MRARHHVWLREVSGFGRRLRQIPGQARHAWPLVDAWPQSDPRGSRYPIFQDSGLKNHTLIGIWDQSPSILGTQTLWGCLEGIIRIALQQSDTEGKHEPKKYRPYIECIYRYIQDMYTFMYTHNVSYCSLNMLYGPQAIGGEF